MIYLRQILAVAIMFSVEVSAQWIPQTVPPDVSYLFSVDMSSPERGVACGYLAGYAGGAIYTSDAGDTWHLAYVPDSSRSLVSVQLFEEGLGYIAGAYSSSVSRESKQPSHRPLPACSPAASAYFDYMARNGMTGGENYRGLFLRSTNYGESWVTWGSLPDSIENLSAMSFVHPDTGWVASSANSGNDAGILKTTDGGVSWTAASISDSIVTLRSMGFFGSAIGVAVGYLRNNGTVSGVMVRTTNGGINWEQHDFPQVDILTGVSVSDSLTAYASGIKPAGVPVVYKTTNAGVDWADLTLPGSDCFLVGVSAASGTSSAVAYGIEYTQDLVAYVARTTNGGDEWMRATLPPVVPKRTELIGGVLLDENNGYLVGGGSDAVVLHTSNGGLAGHFPLGAGNLWQLWDDTFDYVLESEVIGDTTFPNGETYMIVDGHGIGFSGRYVRQEGARVMSYDTYIGAERVIYDFEAEPGDTIGEGGDWAIILEEKRVMDFFGRQLLGWTFCLYFVEWVTVIDSIGLYQIVTEAGHTSYDFQGAIINGVQYGTITEVADDPALPLTTGLFQNYPNPFNPKTAITFSLPRSEEVSLKIFNLLGQETVTLVLGTRDAGTHTVQWDATGQPSGVYFYRLQAGEFVETKKLVLLR